MAAPNNDIRWEQRFSNYRKALAKLSQAIKVAGNTQFNQNPDVEEVIRQGLIQCFEYTHELAWNVMKDYANFQGNNVISGSRDAVRVAFKMNLIEDGKSWMDMITSRNETSHTYDEDTANEIFDKITNHYFPLFIALEKRMEQLSLDIEHNTLFDIA